MQVLTRRSAITGGIVAAGAVSSSDVRSGRPLLPLGGAPVCSWLEFIPKERHAAILAGTSRDDVTVFLQRMLDELPSGSAIFAPGRVNVEAPLVVRRSITLYGIAGRENFDNSWDRGGGGTEILYRGSEGDAIRIEAPVDGNGCMNVMLRDFIVRGARLDDRGGRNRAARSGHGIAIRGSKEETSNIRIDLDNVHVAQAVENGIDLSGHVFGGSIRNAFLHRNGGNGLHAEQAFGIGEMWLARLRLFQNGRDATRLEDKAGMLWCAGTVLGSQISASENAGPGVVLGGGPIQIDMLQLESNATGIADPQARRQLVLGRTGFGITSVRVSALMSDPGADFLGAHVEIAENANNVVIEGVMAGALGPGGRHLLRARGAQGLDIAGLAGWHVAEDRAIDTATRARVQVFARADQVTGRTGDGTVMAWQPGQLLRNDLSAYDPRTGIFTAPVSGLYDVEVVVPLTGLDAQHRTARLDFQATSGARRYRLGNPGALRDGDGRYTVTGRARIPMTQGETLRIVCTVAGGAPSVVALGSPAEGFLTIGLSPA